MFFFRCKSIIGEWGRASNSSATVTPATAARAATDSLHTAIQAQHSVFARTLATGALVDGVGGDIVEGDGGVEVEGGGETEVDKRIDDEDEQPQHSDKGEHDDDHNEVVVNGEDVEGVRRGGCGDVEYAGESCVQPNAEFRNRSVFANSLDIYFYLAWDNFDMGLCCNILFVGRWIPRMGLNRVLSYVLPVISSKATRFS